MPVQPSLSLITGPAAEPVSVSDLKTHLRVDITDDDAYITSLGKVARRMVENITGRRLVRQQWRIRQDDFPSSMPQRRSMLLFTLSVLHLPGLDRFIQFPLAPITSVDSFTYTDANNVTTTVPAASYTVDLTSEPMRLCLLDNYDWPDPSAGLISANAIDIDFTVGYAADGSTPELAKIPDELVHAIKMVTAHFYKNREIASEAKQTEIPWLPHLLNSYRMWRYM